MIGYFATLVIGMVLGKVLFDKELRIKLYNKLHGKRIKQKKWVDVNNDSKSIQICTMCNGDEFVYDNTEKKQIKCPRCNGTGIEPN